MPRTLARLIALAGVLTLAAPGAALPARKGTVKIATQSPLSGELQALGGDGIKLGTELAVERLKGPLERAGFKVEVVPFDDQARPDMGVANARNILADKDVMVVIGHLNSGVAIPASEVYREAGLAMISPANTSPLLTDRLLPNVTRVCGRDDVQGAVAADFAIDALKAKSVYVVHDKTLYGQGIARFFQDRAKERKVAVRGFEAIEDGAGLDALLTAIKAKNPEVLFFGGEYPLAAPVFRQAREKGVKSRFMGPDGLDSVELLKLGGDAVVGVHYTTVAGPVKEYPRARDFADEYRKRFGREPDPFAAQAYDAAAIGLKAIEAAMKEAGGQTPAREAVARAVRNVKLAGITGSIEFDAKGDPKKATYFVVRVADSWNENKTVKRLEIAPPPPGKP